MIKYSFETFDIKRIYAHVFESNNSSVCVLRKSGFSKEACLKKSVVKNNKIQDCYNYSILKPEGDTLSQL